MDRKIQEEAGYTDRLFTLFPEITGKDKEAIRKRTAILSIRKGTFIYRDGEVPRGFICLLEGNAKVVKTGINGRGHILRMVRPMGLLGYRALFAGENYQSAAQTLDNSVIAVIDKDPFFELLSSNAFLSLHILKLIALELGVTNVRTITLTQKYLRGRLADALIFLYETYGFAHDHTINVTLSREDLAQLSSMTTSNAIRTLSAFASEGVVALAGKRIRIVDPDELRRISEMG